MPITEAEEAIRFLKSELERERTRAAVLEARDADTSDQKVLAQTKVNIAELTKALVGHGVFDA